MRKVRGFVCSEEGESEKSRGGYVGRRKGGRKYTGKGEGRKDRSEERRERVREGEIERE